MTMTYTGVTVPTMDWPYPTGPEQGPALPPPPPWGYKLTDGPFAGLPVGIGNLLRQRGWYYDLNSREDVIACALENPDRLYCFRMIGPLAIEEIVRWAKRV